MSAPLVIAARRILDAGASGAGWIRIDDGVILERGPGRAVAGSSADEVVEVDEVSPGLVDIHVHGALGIDFAELGVDPQPAIDHHAAHGATTLVATVATGPIEATATRLRELAPLVRSGSLAGIHLEGPWLSPHRRGAHRPDLLRAPDPRDLDTLLQAGDGAVRMVTLAPELDGAIDAIGALRAQGVVAAIGHTDADAATTERAIEAGATVITHLFNGMRPLHHRDPGPVGLALARPGVAPELIADGVHIDDVVIDAVLRAAGDRVILVSDAMAATGLGDGAYDLAGSRVLVEDGIARLADGSSLAGSTATLGAIVRRLAARGMSSAALVAAASTHPAQALGISAPSLRTGGPADLVVVTSDGRRRTMKAGRWLAS